jgi:minor extracellular serine protease Vpr
VTVLPSVPSIFTSSDAYYALPMVVDASDFRPITWQNPIEPGAVIAIFCTGLGRLEQPIDPEAAAPISALKTATWPQVMIGGKASEVLYSGLAPGYAGLYQINVRVPEVRRDTGTTLQIIAEGVSSNIVQVPSQ